MLHQLNQRRVDGTVDFVSERDLPEPSPGPEHAKALNAWHREITESAPLPEGSRWVLCMLGPDSMFWVRDKSKPMREFLLSLKAKE